MKIRSLCSTVLTTILLAQSVFPATQAFADTIDKQEVANIESSETNEQKGVSISDQVSIKDKHLEDSATRNIQAKANRYKIVEKYAPIIDVGSQMSFSAFFKVHDTQTNFYPLANFTFEGTVDRYKVGRYPVTVKTTIGGESISLSSVITVYDKGSSGGSGGSNGGSGGSNGGGGGGIPTVNYTMSGPEQVSLFNGQSFIPSNYFSVYKNGVLDSENTKKIIYTGNYYTGAPVGNYTGKVSVTVNGKVLTKTVSVSVSADYQIQLYSDEKTIEYGTKFDPVKEFSGYVFKGNLVYDSVKSYEGRYKDGVKSGTYTGNLKFVNAPNSGHYFNLAAPVKINVVRTKLDEATQLVNDLFKDNLHSELKEEINQNNIDTAFAKVNALPDTPEKNDLLVLLEKAQDLLNNPSIVEQAEKNVNDLFGDAEHTILAEGVTQADIDAAKEIVNQVTNAAKKEELLTEIQKAQELLDSQNQAVLDKAKAAVDALFADATHTKLGDNVTQEMIDQASALVNDLPESEQKTQLIADIATAQKLLDKKLQEEAAAIEKAKNAVDALFKDKDHTILADGVIQKNIDDAADLVNKLADGELKEQLLKEISLADKLLNGETAITANSFVIGKSKYVEGTISGNKITKVALEINGVLKKQISASKGNYKYWALDQIIDAKDEVFVVGYDSKGVQISKEPVEVVATSEEIGLDTNLFTIGKDNYVYGSYTGDVTKVALRIDGKLTQKISVKNGEIKYYAKDKITNANSNVELVAFNAADKIVSFKTVKVTNTSSTMSLNGYRVGEGYITGTYTGDAKFMKLIVNGVEKQTIGISNGQIRYYAKDKILSATDKVEIALLDGNKTEVKRDILSIATTLGSLQLNDYQLNSAYLEGSYTGDVVRIRVIANGVTKQTIPVSQEIFKYYARNIIYSSTDNVVVEALDSANNVLDSKVVHITK